MTTHPNVRITLCRALVAAVFIVGMATAGAADAQIAADGLELDDPRAARTAAERELESARAAVAQARAAAIAAKRDLEAAVAASSSDDTQDAGSSQTRRSAPHAGQQADHEGDRRSWASTLEQAQSSETEALKRLISDLKAERSKLLAHLTKRHPLIVDADLRIQEYEEQLAVLRGRRAPRDTDQSPNAARLVVPGEPQGTAPHDGSNARQESPLRLAEALKKWESAQRTLQEAMDTEVAAAEQLATLASRWPITESAEPDETPEPAISGPSPALKSDDEFVSRESRASQPLVLAALVIALVIAAVAAIRLARASDDALFAGVDDAAATLSLPVVGVIPATTIAVKHGNFFQRYRTVTLLLQMLLAVAVFAIVAYIVQSQALRF